MSSLTVRAEQAMLGAVLADPAGQQHVLDLVEPADLHRPWHAQVIAAMRRVQKSGWLPGPVEVYAELRRDPDLPGSECDHLNWPRFGLLSSRISAPPGI